VARLSASARRTLDVAALIGVRVEPRLLQAVGRPTDDLDELVAAGLLVPDGSALMFRHEIVRLAVDGEIPGYRKTAIHAALLDALRQAGDADDAVLAFHADGADDLSALFCTPRTLAGGRQRWVRTARLRRISRRRCGPRRARRLTSPPT
jgi:hypothetical protein